MIFKGFQAGKVNIKKISAEPNHGNVEEPERTQACHPDQIRTNYKIDPNLGQE
jgi:hypothetical protein